MRSLSLPFFLVFSQLAPAQSTWHVDVHGVPPGTGTAADPFTSIQYAIDRPTTLAGDVLLVRPGVYAELVVTPAAKPLAIRSSAGAQETRLLNGASIVADNSLLEGFTIEGTTLLGGSTLRRCVLRGSGQGIGLSYWSPARMDQCVVSGFPTALSMFLFDSGNSTALVARDTIFDGMSAFSGGEIAGTFQNCCTSAALPGAPWAVVEQGTLLSAPGFVDGPGGDVHLRADSPCIDAGLPGLPHDPDGSVADIGVFPFDPAYPPAAHYCQSELNGDGCFGLASAGGVCSASASFPYWIRAANLPSHKLARLLYSFAPTRVPFQGGTLCLAVPIHRTDPSYTSGDGSPCSGGFEYDFHARVQAGVDLELVPGRTVYAQVRYRDPQDPLGFGVGWTDGVSFVIAP